jgi:hypothetical protein
MIDDEQFHIDIVYRNEFCQLGIAQQLIIFNEPLKERVQLNFFSDEKDNCFWLCQRSEMVQERRFTTRQEESAIIHTLESKGLQTSDLKPSIRIPRLEPSECIDSFTSGGPLQFAQRNI